MQLFSTPSTHERSLHSALALCKCSPKLFRIWPPKRAMPSARGAKASLHHPALEMLPGHYSTKVQLRRAGAGPARSACDCEGKPSSRRSMARQRERRASKGPKSRSWTAMRGIEGQARVMSERLCGVACAEIKDKTLPRAHSSVSPVVKFSHSLPRLYFAICT